MTTDYSIHYQRFHDDSESHAIEMAQWLGIYLRDDLPADRSAPALDVGCGFGFALRALKAAGFADVRGIEISPQQAETARRSGCEVAVVSDTAAYLRENRGRYGTILLLDVLEHVPPPAQIDLARAIREALLPGGRLILTVPNANSLLAARWRYIDFTHSSSFTEHSLFFVLKNAGFGQIKLDNTKGVGTFPKHWWRTENRAAVRRWLVRYAWMQVFKAELHPSEKLDEISFELNLKAVAFNDASN